jgi:hypothetical protein
MWILFMRDEQNLYHPLCHPLLKNKRYNHLDYSVLYF